MLPVFTTEQIKNGTGTGDLMIDLSEYMKKQDAATKTDITTLTEILANKLDATPQHKHDIANVKDLREELDSKYDTSKQYSYNVILSDSEKIPYLESPRVTHLELSPNASSNGYNFYKLNNYSNSSTSFNAISSSSTIMYWGNVSYELTTDSGYYITGQLSANGITMYDNSNNILLKRHSGTLK